MNDMKRTFSILAALVLLGTGASAQTYLYKAGSVTHTLPVDLDSLTFRRGEMPATNEGQLPATFTVSATGTQVYFSQGNLQYNPASGTWQFARQQYEVIGSANADIDPAYDGWIDLFGWGTSGYNDCLPTKADGYNSANEYGPEGTFDLTGDNAQYDWGRHNAISNGGDLAGSWRTLTLPEWEYLFSGRDNAAQLVGLGSVKAGEGDSINGVIFLPDGWTLPEGLAFAPYEMGKPGTNHYSAEQWRQMEEAGALFLPAAGSRNGTSVMSVNTLIAYWSASATNSTAAYNLMAASNGMIMVGGGAMAPSQSRNTGLPVRLVRELATNRLLVHQGGQVILDEDVARVDSIKFGTAVYPGEFSVSETGKVRFSQGNLQYQPSTGTWQFAANQYDRISTRDNKQIAPDYDGWIDLFGWGTSGTDPRCLPTEVSASSTETVYGPEGGHSLVGEYASYDWGVYNAISNGGNQPGLWRTLTQAEWEYIYKGRANAANLRGAGNIQTDKGAVNGTILLPDNWTLPEGASFKAEVEYASNSYTPEQWEVMQQAGAIFLPACGGRSSDPIEGGGWEVFVTNFNITGHYWSTTISESELVSYHFGFYDGGDGLDEYHNSVLNYYGFSVRLVQDVK